MIDPLENTLPAPRQLSDTAEYRRAWQDIHHLGDLYRMLPYKVDLTDEQLGDITAVLQRTFANLEAIYQDHVQ